MLVLLAACGIEGSAELVVSGPEGASLPGQGTWLHQEIFPRGGGRFARDLVFLGGYPPGMLCSSLREERVDVLPASLERLWGEVRTAFDAGDTETSCELQRDYYDQLAGWGGSWGQPGWLAVDMGADELDPTEERGYGYLDVVGAIDYTVGRLDCADRPDRRAPSPYDLRAERAHYLADSGTVTADWHGDTLALTLDRYTLAEDSGRGLDDIVLDGIAVVEWCEEEIHDAVMTVPGTE